MHMYVVFSKPFSGVPMLAEIVRIVRSPFTGRGDPSELYSNICRAAILNSFQQLWLLLRRNNLFRENQDES